METNFVGDTAAFACEPGYHLIGPSLVTCVDQPGMAAWTDNFPYCLYSRKKRSKDTDFSPFLRPTRVQLYYQMSGWKSLKAMDFQSK